MTYPLPDEGAVRWLHSYARKNFWRVAAYMDYDDLIQDGYYAWVEVCWRYPLAVANPNRAHLMSLFKLCFSNKVTDLSRVRTKQVDDARSDIVEIYDGEAVLTFDPFDLQTLINKAPQVIKDALALFAKDDTRKEIQKPFAKYDNGRRETLNDRLCKLLGKDPNTIDVAGQLRSYFS